MANNNRKRANGVSRRSVLKRTGSIGAGLSIAGASTGSAASWYSTVYLTATESFRNQHSDPQAKLDSIKEYCQSLWNAAIQDDDSNYGVNLVENNEDVPNSALGGDSLDSRRTDAEDWLATEDTGTYNHGDAHVVLDYCADESARAIGPHDTAGKSDEIVGIVDTWHEANGQLPPAHSDGDGTEALTMRPLLQMYSAQAPDHVDYVPESYVPNVYSVMYNYNGVGCGHSDDDGEVVRNRVSPCTKSAVRDYMDANGL